MHESGEMYLETILVLSQMKPVVRSIDICDYMNFSKPSVSRAVGKLKADGYIEVDGSGYIVLTETGRQIAERIYDRHNTLQSIFMTIGVDEQTAEDDACKLEHYLSDTTYEALKKYFKV
ncbi:MAG: metal-dependent transcriptional regulator [Firmicutes bacterium]|nr:metal-dependent transcriptional regulator [Bacillota bacterium]